MSSECFAYQIALKTLKERCNYLQNKLESVEEENCQLKMQISQDLIRKSPSSVHNPTQLHEEIALLTEQKAQLKHQMQLVTAENHKLWSRLSKLTVPCDDFGNRVSVKGDAARCCDGSVSYTDSHPDSELSKVIISPEANRESLEEISLRLNGVTSEKGETEMQNVLDVDVDVDADNISIQMENFAFSSTDDNRSVLNSLKNHVLKLKHFKQVLQNNKNDLTSAITVFKNLQKNNICSRCGGKYSINCTADSEIVGKLCNVEEDRSDLATLPVHNLRVGMNEETEIPDKMCPLCGIAFSGSFPEFHQHVSDHFSVEEHDTYCRFIP